MNKMNPEAKAKIVEALRSGKYLQTKEVLRQDNCYCVWGVICDISGVDEWKIQRLNTYSYGDGVAVPDPAVQRWAGIHWNSTEVMIDGDMAVISSHNDRGVSFDKLADAIEEQL